MSARPALSVVARSPYRESARPKRERVSAGVKGPVEQLRDGLRPKARVATAMGFLLGGFVPLASFILAHYEIDRAAPFTWQPAAPIVLGGLVYSAKTVFAWGRLAFRSTAKAFGFVVLLEGVMVVSKTQWLSFAALAYLIAINGIATGCNLSAKED